MSRLLSVNRRTRQFETILREDERKILARLGWLPFLQLFPSLLSSFTNFEIRCRTIKLWRIIYWYTPLLATIFVIFLFVVATITQTQNFRFSLRPLRGKIVLATTLNLSYSSSSVFRLSQRFVKLRRWMCILRFPLWGNLLKYGLFNLICQFTPKLTFLN